MWRCDIHRQWCHYYCVDIYSSVLPSAKPYPEVRSSRKVHRATSHSSANRDTGSVFATACYLSTTVHIMEHFMCRFLGSNAHHANWTFNRNSKRHDVKTEFKIQGLGTTYFHRACLVANFNGEKVCSARVNTKAYVTEKLRNTMTTDDVISRHIAMCLIAGAAVGWLGNWHLD